MMVSCALPEIILSLTMDEAFSCRVRIHAISCTREGAGVGNIADCVIAQKLEIQQQHAGVSLLKLLLLYIVTSNKNILYTRRLVVYRNQR